MCMPLQVTEANQRSLWGEELGQTYFDKLGMSERDPRNVSLDLIVHKLKASKSIAAARQHPGKGRLFPPSSETAWHVLLSKW